jgi:hypothetical protein
MPKKLSLYKSVKTKRGWRYCKAAFHSNAKVKPNIVVILHAQRQSVGCAR